MTAIAQLCTVQLGHTARGRLEPAEDGTPAVQLRDTRPEGGGMAQGIGRYRMDNVPERYWAQAGDVLFRSRGDKNTATVLDPDFGGPAVAVMPLVILRPKQDQVDPRYLAWCINQPFAQRHFDECARGTGMRMIPIGCLSSLDIPVPDLAAQRAIAEVDQLAAREHDLATRLAGRRRQLTAFVLLERAKRNTSHHNGAHRAAPRSGKKGDQ
jgi:hypothetical protein